MRLTTKRRLDYILGGMGIAALRPMAAALGSLLNRDHDPVPRREIGVIKMLGGGSLVLATPALLGVRRRYPDIRFLLVTSPAVAPFAQVVGLFDTVVVVDERGPGRLITTGLAARRRLAQVDTVLDLEPHSRLSTVLATLSMARNRVGFFQESAFWRERLATHLIFFNPAAHVARLYEAVARLLGAEALGRAEAGEHVATRLGIPLDRDRRAGRVTACDAPWRACVAPACSDLAPERMLDPAQWTRALTACLPADIREVAVLGSPRDHGTARALIQAARPAFPKVRWENLADGRDLSASLRTLGGAGVFLGIDSSLLHVARLWGIPSVSFWGPTAPARLIGPTGSVDRAYYRPVVCSPCVHTTETPPCGGRNVCIEAAVREAEGRPDAATCAAEAPVPVFTRLHRTP